MIKVSAVSYLNTIPFIYGLKNSAVINEIEIDLDVPSVCAYKLINKKVDIGLVPVVSIEQIKCANIISDYCIGSDGIVETVCVYSDIPIQEVNSIYLDSQSRTSVALLKVLLKEYWKLNPLLIESELCSTKMIGQKNAALVIGDRAFSLNNKHKHIYDLSLIWKQMTGYPFVFAIWVANKNIQLDFIEIFNFALAFGLRNIAEAITSQESTVISAKELEEYLYNRISYKLDDKKKESISLFLKKVKDL